MLPAAVVLGLLSPATAARAVATYPSVTINSPLPGATVTDLIGIGVTSKTDPNGADYPWSTTLYVNGKVASGEYICNNPIAAKTCTQNHLWASDAKNGSYTLQVVMTTYDGVTVSSPTVTVTAKNAPPTVSITSPTGGATVSGPDVAVDAAGLIDASQPFDLPGNLFLDVDGLQVDSLLCGFPASPGCSGSLDWITSASATGAHTLTVRFTTVYGGLATSKPVHVTLVADPLPAAAPTVAITAPATGATVGGTVNITATGTVDLAGGDHALSMGLVVDGQLNGQVQDCNTLLSSCTLTFPWDSTAFSGPHTVQVRLETALGGVSSTGLALTVSNPAPTVVITAPTSGSTVTGVTAVTATGTIDPGQTDHATDLRLVVDGVVKATTACPADAHTCSASFPWDTAGLVGPHDVQVRFDTMRTTVSSAPTTLVVAPRLTKIALAVASAGRPGGTAEIRGSLVAAADNSPIAGAVLRVTFTPVSGQPVTVPATTDAAGAFVATYPLPLASKTSVSVLAGPELGSSSATTVIPVSTPITCAVPAHAKHGKPVTVICSSPLLPNGTIVTLRDLDHGTHVLGTAKAKKGKIRFTVTFPKKRQYRVTLWVTTGSSTLFSPTTSRSYRIWVA
jgi:hypothetical protein